MKYLIALFALFLLLSCQPQAEKAPDEYNQPVAARAATAEQPAEIPAGPADEEPAGPTKLKEWEVDVIWMGKKVIGGGAFPVTDTVFLYLEDANVTIFSARGPGIDEVREQARPPVAGYQLYKFQKPRLIGSASARNR